MSVSSSNGSVKMQGTTATAEGGEEVAASVLRILEKEDGGGREGAAGWCDTGVNESVS